MGPDDFIGMDPDDPIAEDDCRVMVLRHFDVRRYTDEQQAMVTAVVNGIGRAGIFMLCEPPKG